MINTIPLIEKNAYDINRRIVFTMKLLGLNYTDITKFCAFMNLPTPVFYSFYVTHCMKLSYIILPLLAQAYGEYCMKKAAQEEKRMAQEQLCLVMVHGTNEVFHRCMVLLR